MKNGRRETTEQTEAKEGTEFGFGTDDSVFSKWRYLEGSLPVGKLLGKPLKKTERFP
jgi:hypothetical protein